MNTSIDISTFNEQESTDFYNRLVKVHADKLFGVTPSKVLHALSVPKNIRDLALELRLGYPATRKTVSNLFEKGLLVRSDYQSKRGRIYATSYTNVLKAVANSPTGQLLLKEFGVTVPKKMQFQVNRTTIYDKFPEPQAALNLKLGNEPTDIFKVLVASRVDSTRLQKFYTAAVGLIYHVWYRSYQMTEENYNYAELPGPTASEARATLRSLAGQIRQYASMLDQLVDNEVIWADSPAFESWRVLGDLPLQWAKGFSETTVASWIDGVINIQGRPGRLGHDYERARTILEREINRQWIEHQKFLEGTENDS